MIFVPCPARVIDALDLIGRHILGFVNDEVGFHDGTPPDEIQRLGLNQSPLEYLADLVAKQQLILIALSLIGIQKLLQVVDDRAHERRDFLLLIPGQEADILVKLRIGRLMTIRRYSPLGLLYSFSRPPPGNKGLGGPGHALDDDKRRFVRPRHQGLLEKILSHIAGATP